MKHVSLLIKPSSALCNLKCTYCFYNDISSIREVKSYGFMSDSTMRSMIDNVYSNLNESDHLSLVFQGGEPTLVGLSFYKNLVNYVSSKESNVQVHYSIQTNGYTIDNEWAEFLSKNNFLVGLSIDGPITVHNSLRKTWAKEGTYNRVIESKELFEKYGVEYNVICVLSKTLANSVDDLIKFIENENIGYVQFIPCLEDMNLEGSNDDYITPEIFGEFYNKMFKYWLQTLKSGKYISIKLFDDIFNLFARREITACGMVGNCQVQMVIEGDGSTYPCDFYVLDEYQLGNITNDDIYTLARSDNAQKFLRKKEVKEYCKSCPYFRMCAGGCKRMSKSMYVNDSEDYCGYQDLLNVYLKNIDNIVEYSENINRN